MFLQIKEKAQNSLQHSQFPIPSSSLARMGSRIPQAEPLWWVDQGDVARELLKILQRPPAVFGSRFKCPRFLPALSLGAQIATYDYCTFAINTTRLSPI